MIRTAEVAYRRREYDRTLPAAEWAPASYWPKGRPRPDAGLCSEVTAAAEVNHSRWIVCCPLIAPDTGGRCGGAQVAAKSDRRYLCTSCGNAQVGGKWLPVIWPSDKDIARIEAALLARPNEANRNWKPGEKIAALIAENKLMRVV